MHDLVLSKAAAVRKQGLVCFLVAPLLQPSALNSSVSLATPLACPRVSAEISQSPAMLGLRCSGQQRKTVGKDP